jgi:large subunit ribosomal protein L25
MSIKLEAQARAKKEKLSHEFIGAIIYGPGADNTSVKIKLNDFVKTYQEAGESNLIDLSIDGGEKFSVLIKDIQKDPIKDFIIHADLYKVDLSKKVTAEIPLNFIGEPRAIKEKGALLVKNINDLSVECFPGDLVDHIEVDISKLIEIGDIIKVKDLNVPKGMNVLLNPDDSVVTIIEPQKEEEVKKEEVMAEVEGDDKKAEDKGKEGGDKPEKEGENKK